MFWLRRTIATLRNLEDAKLIFAAWSNKTREEVSNTFSQYGGKIIEETDIGNFVLALVKVPTSTTTFYVVCLNTGDLSPVNDDLILSKIPGTVSDPKSTMLEMTKVLRSWIEKYGKLVIGTKSIAKFTSYERLLRKMGFKFADFEYELAGGEKAFYIT